MSRKGQDLEVSKREVRKTASAYWTRRRRIAFVLIQFSWTSYTLGAGAFLACYAMGNLWANADREVNLLQGISLMLLLYLVGGFLILAVLFAALALFFSRKVLALGIVYVPTAIYVYYCLTVQMQQGR